MRTSEGVVSGIPTLGAWRRDLVTVLLSCWVTAGGFVDGFAHRNLDTPESFFTPWHGILYSGFTATVVWLAWLVARNRPDAASLRGAIPDGYETSVMGVIVFAAGGVGDMVWHIFFGIETGIDALFSPTHILLLIGSLLIVSGPLRSRWRDPADVPARVGDFWPALLALTVVAAETSFFFQYVDGFSARFMGTPHPQGSDLWFFSVVAGVASMLLTTVIAMGPLMLALRRWTLPIGTGILYFTALGFAMEALEGFDFPGELVAPIAGGIAADLLLWSTRPGPDRLRALRAFAFLVPTVTWSVRFAVFGRAQAITWPVEIWTGTIVFAGLAGLALSLLAFPGIRSGTVGDVSASSVRDAPER